MSAETLDRREFVIERVPGSITLTFPFDLQGRAVYAGSRTGAVVYATPAPVRLSDFLANRATAEDLAAAAEGLVALDLDRAAEAARDA